MPAASHAAAKAVVRSPRRSQTKFASVARAVQPSADEGLADPLALLDHRLDPLEELVLGVERGDGGGLGYRAHGEGEQVLRTASATGSWPIRNPTRSPARPYALEKVRSTPTLGRSR